MFTTYILYSQLLDRYYIGFTADDIKCRLAKHLANHRGFTGKAKDWILVYQQSFITKQEAMQREKEIKSWKSKVRMKYTLPTNQSTLYFSSLLTSLQLINPFPDRIHNNANHIPCIDTFLYPVAVTLNGSDAEV